MEEPVKKKQGPVPKQLTPETLERLREIFGFESWETCTGKTLISTDLKQLCHLFDEPEMFNTIKMETNKYCRPHKDGPWTLLSLISLLKHVLSKFQKTIVVIQRKRNSTEYKIVDI